MGCQNSQHASPPGGQLGEVNIPTERASNDVNESDNSRVGIPESSILADPAPGINGDATWPIHKEASTQEINAAKSIQRVFRTSSTKKIANKERIWQVCTAIYRCMLLCANA